MLIYFDTQKTPSHGVVLFPIGFKEQCFVDDGALHRADGLGCIGLGFADGVAGAEVLDEGDVVFCALSIL